MFQRVLQGQSERLRWLTKLFDSENVNQKTRENGAYVFQFYTLGEWQKVIVDGKLPLRTHLRGRRRGRTFLAEETNEYWALLLEKAFAKLVGGYMKLEGGIPACALTHLRKGFTIVSFKNCQLKTS